MTPVGGYVMVGQAVVSVAVLVAWLVGPAAVAALMVDRLEAARGQREAVARSRRARAARGDS